MEIKVKKSDVIWNYFGTFFSVCYSMLMLPFVYGKLTVDELGLWYVFNAVSSFALLFDMGFSVTMARHIAYCYSGVQRLAAKGIEANTEENAKVDRQLLSKVLFSSKIIYLAAAGIMLILLQTVGVFYVQTVSSDVVIAWKEGAWRTFAVSIALNLFVNHYYSVMRGTGKIKEINQIQVVSKIVMLVLNISLLMAGYGLLSVAISNIITSCCVLVALKYYTRNITNKTKYKRDGQSLKQYLAGCLEVLGKIWHNAYREGIVTLSTYANNHFGTILISMTGNMAQTAAYSTCVQFVNIVSNVSASYNTAIRPTIQSLFAKGKKQEATKYISLSFAVFYALFALGTVGIVSVGFHVLALLKKDLVIDRIMYLVISAYMFLGKNHSISAQYISDMNNLPYVKAYVLSSAIGLALSFVLISVTPLGIYGYILAVAFVQLCYNNWYWPRYLSRQLDVPLTKLIPQGFGQVMGLAKSFLCRKKKP